MRKTLFAALAGSSIATIIAASPANTQNTQTAPATPPQTAQAPADAEEEEDQKEIIITGTQIRGATTAGATLLTTTAVEAEEQGAANANELLANIPQAANVFQGLPQAGLGQVGNIGVRLPFPAISLRNLPNVNTGGTALTLNLIDGHRIVPIGSDVLSGQGTDGSLISTSMVSRTEILPDGGSAIYGSDAVAGVINYVTRDKFEGVQVQARTGVAGKTWQHDASVIAGTSWDTGNVFGTISYSAHDPQFGRDSYVHSIDANPNSPRFNQDLGTSCFAPNIVMNTPAGGGSPSVSRIYPLLGGPGGAVQPFTTNFGSNGNPASGGATAGQVIDGVTIPINLSTNPFGIAGGNRCDGTARQQVYGKSKGVTAGFGLTQDLTDTLTFSLRGMYARRRSTTYSSTAGSLNATFQNQNAIQSTNINYRKVCNGPVGTDLNQISGLPTCGVTPGFAAGDWNRAQEVRADAQVVLGDWLRSFIKVEMWQVTPSLTWDFAEDWQARALFSYGESRTDGIYSQVDTAVFNSRLASGLINPYNLPASGPGAFDGLVLWGDRRGDFRLLDARVVADGPVPLIRLPAGDIRMALGAEYTKTIAYNYINGPFSRTPDSFIFNPQLPGINTPFSSTQIVKSAFAELQIPLVNEDMNIPLINSLTLSASGRYDDYNTFGSTFNKMFGVNWAPVRWVRLRGNYNTSFAAPNNFQLIGAKSGSQLNNSTTNGGANQLPYFVDANQQVIVNRIPGTNKTTGQGIMASLTNGTSPDIGPQRSRSWSLGFDISPPFVPGLTFGLSYYDLKISGTIGSPIAPDVQSLFTFHPELVTCHGGITGDDPTAPVACLTPMSSAELLAADPGYAVPVNPLDGSGGLATIASLTGTGNNGSGSSISWPQVFANYCEPSVYTSGAGNGANCPVGSRTVFAILDNRNRNLGFVFARGLDLHAEFRTNVPWGTVDARASATVNLETSTQAVAGGTVTDTLLFGQQKWRMSANLGTTWGGLRAQVTWQHGAGYDLSPAENAAGWTGSANIPGSGAYGQSHIGAFDTFDLFFRYDFDSWGDKNGLFKDLSVTLNINNVFDTNPPRSGGTYANGSTLGRMFQLGVTKRFGGED